MDTIDLANAKALLSELVDRVEPGDTIYIARRGRPVARLTAVAPCGSARRQHTATHRRQKNSNR